MEQYAKKRGLASLRYDQSSTGQTTGVTREQVNVKSLFFLIKKVWGGGGRDV